MFPDSLLLLHNDRIRHVIDTITSKVVLILGRFNPERKTVLDAIREELRNRDYLPVMFDFDKPAARDTHEAITTLARLARFIIADITDPKSIPQELVSIVEQLPSLPVQPILLQGQQPWGMFDHIQRYPWVLKVFHYNMLDELLSNLYEFVIAPAEAKAHLWREPRERRSAEEKPIRTGHRPEDAGDEEEMPHMRLQRSGAGKPRHHYGQAGALTEPEIAEQLDAMLTKKRFGETFEEVITKLDGAAPPGNLNREEKQKLLQQICYSLMSGHPFIRYAHGLLLEKLVIDTFFPEWAEGLKNSWHLLKARYEKSHYFIARNAYHKKNHGVHAQPLRLAVEKFWEAFDFDPILYNMDGAQIRVGIWGKRASESQSPAELERQRHRDAQGPDLQFS